MIDYSISMKGNPQNRDAAKKAYAQAQSKENLDLDSFAEHITSHGCVYSAADIGAVLKMAVTCIVEQLLAGNTVTLGELGKFYLTFSSRGADTAEDFTAANIKKVTPKWRPDPSIKNLVGKASFNCVLPRTTTATVLAAQKSGETTVTI